MSTHPNAAIGENTNIVFFLPKYPEKKPPRGAKIIALKKLIEANQDSCSFVKFKYGKDTVAKPTKMPFEVSTMLTAKAAKI